MKREKKLVEWMEALIKKNFFNIWDAGISCKDEMDPLANLKPEEAREAEEYFSNYWLTTRWQTV